MKIKLIDAVRCYKAITEITDNLMDFSTAHKLVIAKHELEPHVTFYSETEREIVDKYAITDDNGKTIEADGTFKIPSDKMIEFNTERAELNNIELEISIGGKIKNLPDVKPSTVEALMGIFEMEDSE